MTPGGQAGSILAMSKKGEPVYEGREMDQGTREKEEMVKKRGFLKWLSLTFKNSNLAGR